MEKIVEASYEAFKPTGLCVAVVKDGRVVLSKGWGSADKDANRPAESGSLFNIASCTKAFTAACIGMLVAQGKLRWEDKVIDHIAGFQLSDACITSQLTVRDLLCHRSGLGTFDGDLLWYGTDYTDEQILAHLRHLPIRQDFRSEFGYQNNLYMVAGLLIQEVTGKSWSEFVRDNLFLPLGMNATCASNDELPPGAPLARGHLQGQVQPIYDFTGCKPAASIYSSVDDLSHWVRMWLDGGRWNGRQILDPKTIRTLTTGHTLMSVSPAWESWGIHFRSYALGWILMDYGGKRVIEHNGGMPGYISKVMILPESNLGLVVLNNGNDGMVNDVIRFKVLDHFLGLKGPDWDRLFRGYSDQEQENQQAATASREAARKPGTQPSLPLTAYAGAFFDRTYGEAKVELQGNRLMFTMVPARALFTGEMEHFHYDTWKVHFRDPYLPFALVTFELTHTGDVCGLKIDLPSADFHFHMLDFRRKA
ncbi:MAG: hypothetical protein RLZZ165_1188 [Bacteroidota bacterium]